ncbi:P-loop containing nucleoside triphosphate hydrolase protein [Gymnopilus junonius]|uniref:P-loop containing nucleoside triphosphate hydrolase protein n=1 Tax=Gymnopilus junonius TaxID=109634 RepID=A0A9P5N6E4_GYMJU|nr:P-loop containing nucleoside triphosphate hydrolase protein [Gymnopilus junonius]
MAPPPCRYHKSPGGCAKGNNCNFAHIDSTPSSPRSSSASPSPSSRRGPGPRSANEQATLPPGVCSFYWTRGECKKEFKCRYRHIRPDSNPQPSPSPSRRPISFSSSAAREMVIPFLTERGLAKVNSNATDGFFAGSETSFLSPTEAHGRLTRFLRDDFRFKTSFDVYAFLVPLSSANASNTKWTQEEGQLLLGSLTSTNGSLRIADIVNWPAVSMKAGQSREILSFQKGFLPLLRYMSSEFVVKSTLMTQANHLYTIVLQNLDRFSDAIESSLEQAIKAQSFKDPTAPVSEPTDAQVFASIAGVLHEFLVRFKNVVANHPRLAQLVKIVNQRFGEWHSAISANPAAFGNSFKDLQPTVRDLLVGSMKEKIDRIASILEREEDKVNRKGRKDRKVTPSFVDHQDALVAALQTTYEGPGHLREEGPRHDNDLEDIYEIRIAPTNGELMSRLPPFLPGNFFAAPHPAPPSSMQRLLDIQFRLLREELIAPLRKAVQLVDDDLTDPQIKKTKLWDLLQKQGGRYRGLADTQDSLMFNVYTNVQFTSLVPDWKGISTSILIDTPPGRARSSQSRQRTAFWDSMSGKRLSQGGLIALVWKSGRRTEVHLGIIASSSKELTDHVRVDGEHVKLRIVFFDSQVELRVLQDIRNARSRNFHNDTKILVESPVMFESIRPFLEALQTEPEDVPFSRYLVHQPADHLATLDLLPPRYALLPNFKFQLSSLFNVDAGVDELTLSVTDPESVRHARALLREKSRLDPSQADAVVDTLTREVSLIQGPPGTGKSFTGVEILRVLQANEIGPILMIAFTNHALDHMLGSVLDAGITSKIVRLGRRSNDERIAQYSIETLEMAQNSSRLDRAYSFRRELKDVQQHIKDLMRQVLHVDLENDSNEIMKYLSTFHPEHHDYFSNPPLYTSNIRILLNDDDADAGGWQRTGRNGKSIVIDTSNYAFWKECDDLNFLEQVTSGAYPPASAKLEEQAVRPRNMFSHLVVEDSGDDESESESESDESGNDDSSDELAVEESWQNMQYEITPQINISVPVEDPPSPSTESFTTSSTNSEAPLGAADFSDIDSFLASIGFADAPVVPTSDRPLEELLENVGNVWTMSASERQRLHKFWVDEARKELGQSYLLEFERLRGLHADKLKEVNEIKEEVRRSLLHKIDIIGCTTTGAAQLATLLKGLSPKVLLVEEAGQVMEAHILGSLVPSIEHLILIGDPLQLRPTLNNFALSMDNRRGRAIYRFDMSLMERLSESGIHMSTIDVQRRMRPTISSLIRNTLYPKLEDHKLVHNYPDVRGIHKNVFFVTHQHRENDGGDDSASKYNTYEVAMIRDLVLYLLRQGCYSDEGDIVVLCAYLGQLARLRDALGSEVAVIIDERDQAALDDQEGDGDVPVSEGVSIERVNVTKRVRLRTVDNYQGEEGRIVILSLVRNAGGLEDEAQVFGRGMRPNIGFLKSENRTNVALSRAREGLYIFGNADNLSSRSQMWHSIIEELQSIDCIGPALPVACHRHPDKVEYVAGPGLLPQIAPDGGCLRPCETRLTCGHNCPYKCHCDDPRHVTVVCSQPCRRLCSRDHPCNKRCSEECGQCLFPVANVALPCGHIKTSVECYRLDKLETVHCDFQMEKALPTCEHIAIMACSQDPSAYRCTARCSLNMSCCSKSCKASCFECKSLNFPQSDKIVRSSHKAHPCEKALHCGHICREACSEDHRHTDKCMEKCRQICVHAQCRQPCSVPCAPCQEPCAWICAHHSCPVPCGSVCVRLPCDLRCTNTLVCGHRCPSVCGEDCSMQSCPQCSPPYKKEQVVDLILSRTLADIEPESGGLDDLVITIPSCRHVFTVETLDGHTGMTDFYTRNAEDTKWIGLKSVLGFVKPPTCPTCRAQITCNRYGRITKRAALDILERNVASHMSRSLDRWLESIQNFDEQRSKVLLVDAASNVTIPSPKKLPPERKLKTARSNVLKGTEDKPVPDSDILAGNTKLHCIDSAVITAWRKATHLLFTYYAEIIKVANTRSAHTQAWEASFSFLYEREIETGLKDPARMPRSPKEHAMRMAKLQVGQQRPLADKRFLVEAFWATIHIRLVITRLAQAWLDEVGKDEQRCPPFHFHQWATYIRYLLSTCSLDANKALKIANDSKSHRQIIKSVLLCLRIELEAFRFNLYMQRAVGNFKKSDTRNALREEASRHGRECREEMLHAVMVHMKETGSRAEEAEWVDVNFTTKAQAIVDEWNNIEQSIWRDTFYQPVLVDEKMDILRAFGFGSTGHFYTCPNGHIYTITECGGAMERSRCPECGEAIGGSNHRLDSTNQVSSEFEELARRVDPNVARSPWANPH